MSVEQENLIVHDRSEWRAMVSGWQMTALTTHSGGSRTSHVTLGSDQLWGGRGT